MTDVRAVVVVPTYDERDNLPWLVAGVLRAAPSAHVLVVDDASPDGTGEEADALAAADPRVSVLHREAKLGLGAAYVAGFTHALAEGYDAVVQMDADLSHDPRDVPRLLAALEEGADVAVGSRNVPGGSVRGWGPGRHLLSKGGSLYSRWVLGVPVRDLTSGFKAWRRTALLAVDVPTLRANGYAFQIEATYRALRQGLSVVEVPITFVDRRAGQSKMSSGIVAEAVWKVPLLRRRSPP